MHEQPTAMPERVTVGLLNWRTCCRAYVGQENRRFDLIRELTQIAVTPSRLDAAIQPGDVLVAIPAQAEAICVGIPTCQAVPAALLNERMLRLVEQYLGPDRISKVGHPTAHSSTLSDSDPAGGNT